MNKCKMAIFSMQKALLCCQGDIHKIIHICMKTKVSKVDVTIKKINKLPYKLKIKLGLNSQ